MIQRKLSLLTTLCAFLLFSMNAWQDGRINYVTLIGGIGITILIYFIVSNVLTGLTTYRVKQETQNEVIVDHVSQLKSANEAQFHELGQNVNSVFFQQAELLEKRHSELALFQEKLLFKMEDFENHHQERTLKLQKSITEGIENLNNTVNQQYKVLKEMSSNIVEHSNREEKISNFYREMVEQKFESINRAILQQTDSFQENLLYQQNFIQSLMERVDASERSTQALIQEQIGQHLTKTEEVINSIQSFSKGQQTNFNREVSQIISEIKIHSREQLQSIDDLAQTVKDNGIEQHQSIVQSLSSYQEGLNSVLQSMKESATGIQTEISNQSNRQMDKIEDVIGKQKEVTLLFREKIKELLTNVQTSMIETQKSIADSSSQQVGKLEQFAITMNAGFEEMQGGVKKRTNEQYESLKLIINQLSNSVHVAQVVLDGYTKEHVGKLNEVVETMKSEITATIEELKLQGHNQLDKMQDFLESSKNEAKVIQTSLDQHHDFLLKRLENSLEKIIHFQNEENKVIVQKTAEFINQFSVFHQELLGENKKQLELTEEHQSKLEKQIAVFKDMLIPLSDLHNNLQAMSKEEYRKLNETMKLLSASIAETMETKDSLRTQIIRMQDDMLQKLR